MYTRTRSNLTPSTTVVGFLSTAVWPLDMMAWSLSLNDSDKGRVIVPKSRNVVLKELFNLKSERKKKLVGGVGSSARNHPNNSIISRNWTHAPDPRFTPGPQNSSHQTHVRSDQGYSTNAYLQFLTHCSLTKNKMKKGRERVQKKKMMVALL